MYHLSVRLLGICISSSANFLFIIFAHFSIASFAFSYQSLGDLLYFEYQVLVGYIHANIFPAHLSVFNLVYDFSVMKDFFIFMLSIYQFFLV